MPGMFFYRDTPLGNIKKPWNNDWVSRYPEDTLEANYHLWEMNVPINPNTGLPTIIGWQESYPAGSLSHLSAYEEKLIRLLTGNCTRDEAYAFLRKGNYMFDIVQQKDQHQNVCSSEPVPVTHPASWNLGV